MCKPKSHYRSDFIKACCILLKGCWGWPFLFFCRFLNYEDFPLQLTVPKALKLILEALGPFGPSGEAILVAPCGCMRYSFAVVSSWYRRYGTPMFHFRWGVILIPAASALGWHSKFACWMWCHRDFLLCSGLRDELIPSFCLDLYWTVPLQWFAETAHLQFQQGYITSDCFAAVCGNN